MATVTKIAWFIPTNTENLQMMLAQGLITDSNGFAGTYYNDVLSEYPGFIPLFKNEVPLTALNMAISEASDLTCCIIKINLSYVIDGYGVHTRTDIDNALEVPFKETNKVFISSLNNKKSDEVDFESMLIQAPLPLSCIEEVIFQYKSDLDEFKTSSSNVGNVSIAILKCKVDKNLFEPKSSDAAMFDSRFCSPEHNTIEYSKPYSFGGLVALSFYFSKNGEESTKLFNSIAQFEEESSSLEYKWIYEYFFSSEDNNKFQKWNIILDTLNHSKKRDDSEYKNTIVEFLDSTVETQFIAEFLTDYHRSKVIKSDADIIEKFIMEYDEEPKKFKIQLFLFMFFYKDNLEKLIEFNHASFREEDYVLIGMLFGMKNGFIGLPKWLVEYEHLHLYLSTIMANYAHLQAKTGLHFKAPPKPLLLNEMLSPKKVDFISWLSKSLNLNECFESVMPNKEFTCVKGKSTYAGIVMPEFRIIKDKYFKTISTIKLDDTSYNKICKEYKGK